MSEAPEGMTYRKVKMSPELMKEWASRDKDCNRLIWNWGEPDADGFYTPIIEVRYDDNPLNALIEEAKARERDMQELRVQAWSALAPYVSFEDAEYGADELAELIAVVLPRIWDEIVAATLSEQEANDDNGD